MLIEYLFGEFPKWEEIGEQAIGDLQVSLENLLVVCYSRGYFECPTKKFNDFVAITMSI